MIKKNKAEQALQIFVHVVAEFYANMRQCMGVDNLGFQTLLYNKSLVSDRSFGFGFGQFRLKIRVSMKFRFRLKIGRTFGSSVACGSLLI
jgi:hypothetical protein